MRGLIKGRSQDTLTIRADYKQFGRATQDARRAAGRYANSSHLQMMGSYSTHATKGMFLVPALSYVKNPAFTGDFEPAMLGSLTI
jgi:carbohydrate-selective porin OprB